MPYNRFTPRQPDPFIKKAADQEIAKFGHLNYLLGLIDNISSGGVQTITGLDTDNTDPDNPVIQISVDGTTITGDGTPGNPLTAASSSSILTQEVPLTAVQIRNAFNNSPVLITNPGGVIIDLLSVIINNSPGGTPFSSSTAYILDDGISDTNFPLSVFTALLDNGGVGMNGVVKGSVGADTAGSPNQTVGGNIVFKSDATSGAGNGTMIIYLVYRIIS